MRARIPQSTFLAAIFIVFSLISSNAFSDARPYRFGYPRLWLYGRWSSQGAPFDNDSNIGLGARAQTLVLPVEPATSNQKSAASKSWLLSFRQKNPGAVILGYMWTDFLWSGADSIPSPHIVADLLREVKHRGWYLLNQKGGPWAGPFGGYNLDFANLEFVDWYVEYIAQEIYQTNLWEGIYFDNFCDTIGFYDVKYRDAFGNPTPEALSLTQAAKSYATLSDYDAAHKIGMTRFIENLRAKVGQKYIMVGNCGVGGHENVLNGSVREYFPTLNTLNSFSKWWDNMFGPGPGYLTKDRTMLNQSFNFITAFGDVPNSPNFLSARSMQLMRYGLTSAMLGDGFYFLDQDSPASTWLAFRDSWYDEYDNAGMKVGYLGQALGSPYQLIDRSKLSGAELWDNGDMEMSSVSDLVTSGWTLAVSGAGNSWGLDSAVKHEGLKALHASVPSLTNSNDSVGVTRSFSTATSGLPYSLTFWAKADSRRLIEVQLRGVEGAAYKTYMDVAIQLDSSWREYQFSAVPLSPSNLSVSFYLGSYSGDVWLDGVSLKQGYSNIWVRDFEHGSSFVNPCPESFAFCSNPQSFTLNSKMRRITGTQNPSLNNGQLVSSVSIPPTDGLILLSESNPPSANSAKKPLAPSGIRVEH